MNRTISQMTTADRPTAPLAQTHIVNGSGSGAPKLHSIVILIEVSLPGSPISSHSSMPAFYSAGSEGGYGFFRFRIVRRMMSSGRDR